ncbi:hypothetical protein ACFLYD_06955 [Chloroflexota bacterium]
MAYKSNNYKPNAKSRVILDRAWEHVQSVPYRVTARWLFYRILQDGLYHKKSDYNRFLGLLSRARHNDYQGWYPGTLADDQRQAVERGDGPLSVEEWGSDLARRAQCKLARWEGQDQYVEIWFEAGAMRAQFEHYTEHITLRPFAGMPSIPYKWEMARALDTAYMTYGLPLVVLYFGDLDEAGLIIPETTIADVRGWCSVPFDVVRCGLNRGHEVQYNIPENPDHPRAFQWEALEDGAAKELITKSVAKFVDYDRMAEIEAREDQATNAFREHMRQFVAGQAWTK